jgi:hypothetical protein
LHLADQGFKRRQAVDGFMRTFHFGHPWDSLAGAGARGSPLFGVQGLIDKAQKAGAPSGPGKSLSGAGQVFSTAIRKRVLRHSDTWLYA